MKKAISRPVSLALILVLTLTLAMVAPLTD